MALRNRISPEDFGQLVLTAIGFLLLVWLIIVSAGCKTQKHEYHYTGEDFSQVVDSTHAEGHTEQVAKDSASTTGAVSGLITFTDGGGTITTGGGVTLTGVQSIDGEILSSGQMFHVEQFNHDTAFEAEHDNLHKIDVQEVETETESKAQNYWWVWLLVGLAVGAGGLIALKKIPYTRPFMMWL